MIWIERRADADVEADLRRSTGPLAGRRLAVKDNVDVAGLPTTAGCPSFGHVAERTALAVERLVAAGATVAGKTAMDQFATGLVGTRSPHGAVESPVAPRRVAGGSSSGSAAAVAASEADLGVGTDTAGSGRVPAAFCGIVGVKGTRGWIPNLGTVPACPSFDCTTVFARTIAEATTAAAVMAGPCDDDPSSRRPPATTPPPVRRIGIPDEAALARCEDVVLQGFGESVKAAIDAGFDVREVDLTAYLAAGRLLYGGAFVAERAASFGAHLRTCPDADPSVAAIVASAEQWSAEDLARDRAVLDRLRVDAARVWAAVDAVLLPTAPFHPTVAEVAADPLGVNGRLGEFVSGCNLVDWCAIAFPAPAPAERPVGVQLLGPAWADRAVWAAAAAIAGEDLPEFGSTEAGSPGAGSTEAIRLTVVGAHLTGQPLSHQLTDLDGRLDETTTTAPRYRLVALDGPVAKPGLFRVDAGGGAVEAEVWSLSPAAFGRFVAAVPPPLTIGNVELRDGTWAKGFLCEPHATAGAEDITHHGGWRAWLASRA